MIGQSLLDTMELLNQELQLQTSENDQVRGLLALNVAQDYFESRASQEGSIKGDQTGNVLTAANTETSAFPSGFLRVDRIQLLDSVTLQPVADIDNISRVGGHANKARWPYSALGITTPGAPEGYYTNGRNIYWSPLPDNIYTLRVYGFKAADDITALGTFAYEDEVRLPLAAFATMILKIGVDDSPSNVSQLADAAFKDVIASLSGTNRDGAAPLEYTRFHEA